MAKPKVTLCGQEVMDIAKVLGRDLSEDEAEEIVSVMNKKLQRRGAVGESDVFDVYVEAEEIVQQARINAAIEKRNRLLNARAYGRIQEVLKQYDGDPAAALSAIMVGDARRTLDSVDAQQHSIMTDYTGALAAELKRNDVLDIFKSGEADELISRIMFGDEIDPNTAGFEEATKIAESIKKVQKALLDRKNRNGANIGELENYIVRQSHDPSLMRGKGTQQDKDAWVSFVMERIDHEKTFASKPRTTQRLINGKMQTVQYTDEMFLGDMYDNLVTGDHQKAVDVNAEKFDGKTLNAFKGPSNLAKKVSGQRLIHFKDGKASNEYSRQYSRMNLVESVLNGITHDAQNIALLETFGTNPRAMFEKVIDDMKKSQKGDIRSFEKISEAKLQKQFAELDGSVRGRAGTKPLFGTVDLAGIAAGVRMIQNMAKLGMATISSFSDIATKAAFINANTERGIFGSYYQSLKDVFDSFPTKERQELAFLLDVGVENMLGDVHARFGANDSGPGKIAKLHQHYFRLNGMAWWNNAQKTGIARLLAADLANYANKGWDKVPPETKRLLELYNITEAEFGLFKGAEMKAADGRNYLVAAMVDDVPAEKIDVIIRDKMGTLNITDNMRQQFRDDLRTKIASYYTDSANTAIPTPGARERAIMNQGLPRGTVAGEAIRMVMQLKGFPITYATKGMGRMYASSGYLGVAKMMTGTAMMGYVSLAVKDVLKGREPRDPRRGRTLIEAFVQGGGAGIYGDFIFGEFNRYGQSPLQTFAGPTLGTAEDVLQIWAKMRDGDDAGAAALRLAVSNTPYLNLFYSKMAVDYLFLHDLQEYASPGYLKRMERRMEKDAGIEFYASPDDNPGLLGGLR